MLRSGKGDRVWRMLHGCPQFLGMSFKKTSVIKKCSPVSRSSGGWWFGGGHLRGEHAVRRSRSRAEWLTAASEVPSFPPCNHWVAGWSEEGRGVGRRGGREREQAAVILSGDGFAAR